MRYSECLALNMSSVVASRDRSQVLRFASPSAVQPESRKTAQILRNCWQNPHPAVGIVHPADWQFDHLKARPLRMGQQFGVKKPVLVLHLRQQQLRSPSAQGLEAALRIMDSEAEDSPEQAAIASREYLPL